jgi:cytochrome c oxidase cbb3-type subunit I/II
MQTVRITYDDKATRWFIGASVLWGIVGMLVGAFVALQLAFPEANVASFLSFSRLRPLHTNAVIFAFVGNMLFAGVYYSTQRLFKQRLASNFLTRFHFWGWQLIIVAAAITLPLGITSSKEYAELEWPIDIAIAVVWVAFAVNFFWTLARRNEKQLYVAIWFYIATIVTVAVLHIVNSLAVPVSLTKSYPIYAGVQDALVQWWYGHNAVAFFLTTPILGIMYYFLPKAAERPVFSYRLSVVHFWGLVFLYIWAGPHHLLYTALPEWAQTLGMVFSLMLWAPSWGGMINGLFTLRGAWDKVRRDPVLKFFAAGVTFYGMATFEGPLLSIKSVNGLAHFTDWIVAHVHGGALGWNGFMAAGMFYWLVPRLFGTELRSQKVANAHFYIGTIGILLYMGSMWASGITQGLMWRAETEDGGFLYPNFIETVAALKPLYWTRLVGGTLYLVGFVMLAWNLWATARKGKPVDTVVEVTVESKPKAESDGTLKDVLLGKPLIVTVVVVGLACVVAFVNEIASTVVIVIAFAVAVFGVIALRLARKKGERAWHGIIEGKAAIFTVFTVIAILVGGVAELIPTFVTGSESLATTRNVPYTALELEGRDVYISEGCYVCHSQMIRPFTWETARYGEASSVDDSIFDHPFQWGSKRTGPDLAREGGLRSNLWHYQHFMNPRALELQSVMPSYAHLADSRIDYGDTDDKMRALRSVGVPYGPETIATSHDDALAAGRTIAGDIRHEGSVEVAPDSELVALIGYMQRLGRIPAASAPDDDGGTQVSLAGQGE